MSRQTSKVQSKRHRALLQELGLRVKIAEEEARVRLTARIEAGDHGPFFEPEGARRHYPGEAEANYLLAHIEYLSQFPKKQKAFLESFRKMQRFEQASHERDEVEARKRWPAAQVAFDGFTKTILKGRLTMIDVHKHGVVAQPAPGDGVAALAVLSLAMRHGGLLRIRQCLHCGSLFYARFSHQQFCGDAKKKCQWNYYHSPAWRKQNREKNRKHQSEYRKRNPGRRR